MTWWIVKGPPENWEVAFEKGNIWGVTSRYEKLWQQMKEGDGVLFYATSPVKGLIGYGTVRSVFRDEKPFWPAEVREGKALWPLRFSFDISFLLPNDQWEAKSIRVSPRQSVLQRGLQRIKGEIAKELVDSLES